MIPPTVVQRALPQSQNNMVFPLPSQRSVKLQVQTGKVQMHMLGTYNTLEETAVARRAAEKVLFDGTVQFYEKWKAKETRDPEWGKTTLFLFRLNKLRPEN